MVAFHLLAYYILAFLLEEDLFHALRQGGLRLVWAKSKLLSTEFCLLYYPIIVYSWSVWLPARGDELWQSCQSRPGCRVYLRRTGWGPLQTAPRYSIIDLADIQWRAFRGALPLLAAAAVALAALVRLAAWAAGARGRGCSGGPGCGAAGGARRVPGALVRLPVGLGFLLYVHGAGAAFPAALALLFYCTAAATAGTRAAPPALWALALLAIITKEPYWPVRRHLTFGTLLGPSWAFLDDPAYQGEYDWAQSVNLILLRLLSFTLDWHAAALRRDSKEEPNEAHPVPLRCRYSFLYGLSHAFYAPVVLAGPTIGFDDFLEQCAVPRATLASVGWYLARLAGALAILEAGTHLYPCFALMRSGALGELGPELGSAAIFLTLNLMWLKFLVLWRIARAWALLEGIDVPENMRRSLCNHYSVMDFWRCWHASFNRWLVRYIYVPAGGRARKVSATALTFAFVALWHDAEAKLMAWGVLNAVFLTLETCVASAWSRWGARLASRQPWAHRQLGAMGGATCIIALMAVNMIGFSVGVSGISGLLATAADAAMRTEVLWTVLSAYLILFSSVQVMMEVRRLDGTWTLKSPSAAAARQDAASQVSKSG